VHEKRQLRLLNEIETRFSNLRSNTRKNKAGEGDRAVQFSDVPLMVGLTLFRMLLML
jgi:hypothetical protein